ncbi:hypothetical protein MAP00_002392 [Monascus purpureus]|nr:hypothetical protein MAP00_002392 [Monascus purpureus]
MSRYYGKLLLSPSQLQASHILHSQHSQHSHLEDLPVLIRKLLPRVAVAIFGLSEATADLRAYRISYARLPLSLTFLRYLTRAEVLSARTSHVRIVLPSLLLWLWCGKSQSQFDLRYDPGS